MQVDGYSLDAQRDKLRKYMENENVREFYMQEARDPYVLEFLGLTPNDDIYESDLKQALITHLKKWVLVMKRNNGGINERRMSDL